MNFARTVPLLGALFVAIFAGAGCRTEAVGGPIKAVSTTGMVHDLVVEIGGGRVASQALMGPGVDPHLYRATASDVARLESADLVFYNGLELEGRMAEIFAQLPATGKTVVAVAERVPVDKRLAYPGQTGKHDPHVWFDPALWRYAAEAVRDALSARDPEGAPGYGERCAKFVARLDELDAWAKSELARVPEPSRVLVTAHDAFGYFGRRYGYRVLGIQGTSTATEASANTLIRLADEVAKLRIKAVFVESSVPTGTVDALKKAVRSRGWEVGLGPALFSDAMGPAGDETGTYIGMFRHNVTSIVEALR
jgi:manganese/zinc/iron transport system substrate-binding protein